MHPSKFPTPIKVERLHIFLDRYPNNDFIVSDQLLCCFSFVFWWPYHIMLLLHTTSHMQEHMDQTHKQEPEVKKIRLCTDSAKKRTLQNLLRYKGDNKHNKAVIKQGHGELLVSRRPSSHTDLHFFSVAYFCYVWVGELAVSRRLACWSMTSIRGWWIWTGISQFISCPSWPICTISWKKLPTLYITYWNSSCVFTWTKESIVVALQGMCIVIINTLCI